MDVLVTDYDISLTFLCNNILCLALFNFCNPTFLNVCAI